MLFLWYDSCMDSINQDVNKLQHLQANLFTREVLSISNWTRSFSCSLATMSYIYSVTCILLPILFRPFGCKGVLVRPREVCSAKRTICPEEKIPEQTKKEFTVSSHTHDVPVVLHWNFSFCNNLRQNCRSPNLPIRGDYRLYFSRHFDFIYTVQYTAVFENEGEKRISTRMHSSTMRTVRIPYPKMRRPVTTKNPTLYKRVSNNSPGHWWRCNCASQFYTLEIKYIHFLIFLSFTSTKL